MAQAAPAASHSSDSIPRALSREPRTDEAESGFIVQLVSYKRGHYTDRSGRRQVENRSGRVVYSRLRIRIFDC
jgi:hypothetical protein